MARAFNYGGVTTRIPTVRSLVDDSRMNPANTGRLRNVAILGIAEGGKPGTPEPFASPSRAAERLRGGDLVTALRPLFSPSPESLGPATVYFVRVNPATQATKYLQDAVPANVIQLTSVNYGQRDNGIRVSVASGTTAGKKLTIGDGITTVVKDNLYRESFQIEYTGSTATMTITATTLTTTVTGGTGTSLNITLASYPTVKKLVDYIAAQTGYTCTLLDTNPDRASILLDQVTTVNIIAAQHYKATATLDEIVVWLNSGAQPFVTATRVANAGTLPANVTNLFLAGGAEGTATNTEWQAAFDALNQIDVTYVVPLTSDATIHAMALQAVQLSSADGRRPRRAFVGAALGEKTSTLGTYTTRVTALNSDRVALAIQGITVGGVALAPYFTAALFAGLQAGLPEIGDALTNRVVSIEGLEWTPTNAELEIALAGGMLPIGLIQNRGGYNIVRGISTWLKDDSYHRVEISSGDAMDEIIFQTLLSLDRFKGKKATESVAFEALSTVEATLKALHRQDVVVDFSGLEASLDGDTILIEYQVVPVNTINFIGVKLHAVPPTGTVTLALNA